MWSLMWSGRLWRKASSSMPLVFCHFSSSCLLIISFRFSGRLLLDIQISVSLFLSSISSILVVFDCRYFCDHQKNQLYEIKIRNLLKTQPGCFQWGQQTKVNQRRRWWEQRRYPQQSCLSVSFDLKHCHS